MSIELGLTAETLSQRIKSVVDLFVNEKIHEQNIELNNKLIAMESRIIELESEVKRTMEKLVELEAKTKQLELEIQAKNMLIEEMLAMGKSNNFVYADATKMSLRIQNSINLVYVLDTGTFVQRWG